MRNRADTNQADIVSKLRDCGCKVEVLSQVGNGFPDLLVGFRGVNMLMEVKGKTGKLSDEQVEWHADWRGQVAVVRSYEDAMSVIKQVLGNGE